MIPLTDKTLKGLLREQSAQAERLDPYGYIKDKGLKGKLDGVVRLSNSIKDWPKPPFIVRVKGENLGLWPFKDEITNIVFFVWSDMYKKHFWQGTHYEVYIPDELHEEKDGLSDEEIDDRIDLFFAYIQTYAWNWDKYASIQLEVDKEQFPEREEYAQIVKLTEEVRNLDRILCKVYTLAVSYEKKFLGTEAGIGFSSIKELVMVAEPTDEQQGE